MKDDALGPGLGMDGRIEVFRQNVLHSPLEHFDVGLQYLWARREIEEGTTGVSQRVSCAATKAGPAACATEPRGLRVGRFFANEPLLGRGPTSLEGRMLAPSPTA